MTVITERIIVDGMHCTGCEEIIVQALGELPGVEQVAASYSRQTVNIRYDAARIGRAEIERALIAKGYGIRQPGGERTFWQGLRRGLLFLSLFALVGGVAFWGKGLMPEVMRQIRPGMEHLLLLSIGFLTGFHCIGMCGGFVVAYTDTAQAKWRQMMSHVIYGMAKTLSYSVLGAGFGLLGASIAFTPALRGGLALAASVFLLLYGLRMLNVFAGLRRFVLRLPAAVNRDLHGDIRKRRSPLLTGLLSGLLLGCGPLQAMYVMAAGSGDPRQGATMLLMFGLGTLPPLWGFGLFASLLSVNAMRQLVRVSGILVIVMGAMMAQRGLTMLKGGTMPTGTVQHSMH